MLQTCRTAFAQRLLEAEHTFVIDIVVEIDVYLGSLVGEQKPSGLGETVPVCVLVNQYCAYAQGSFEQALDSIL